MASYITHNQRRDPVTLMLSKAEAEALRALALAAYEKGLMAMNGQTSCAAERALRALSASTQTAARRAGFFDA